MPGSGHVINGWRSSPRLLLMVTPPDQVGGSPEGFAPGAVRVARQSANYDQTLLFYRDLIGLPVLESFEGSFGEDGTIFGLPDASVHLEIVRSNEPAGPADRIDMLVFYLPDLPARDRLVTKMEAAGVRSSSQHPYWQANGGVTFRDPDGRQVVFVPWVYGTDRT